MKTSRRGEFATFLRDVPRLYGIPAGPQGVLKQQFRDSLVAGCGILQLRVKDLPTGEMVTLAQEMKALFADDGEGEGEGEGEGRFFIVNDRSDVALLARADGVHLGQDDLPPEVARKVLGEDAIIGFSTHNLDQVAAANDLDIDYIGFGPVYATGTKADASPVVGLDLLAEAVKLSIHPVIAIGGMTLDTIPEVLTAGVAGIAMISAIYGGGSISGKVRSAMTKGLR